MITLCFYNTVKAQVNENFSDGDFTSNPTWFGDVGNWKVSSQLLTSNAPVTATQSHLSTINTMAINTQWEFLINLKFATSSVNYSDIFLISDSVNLAGLNSGIFVRVGNTSDEISLYRKDGSTITKIIDGLDGKVSSTSNNIFKIKVTRAPNNEFKLYDDPTGIGNSYALEGKVIETAYQNSAWFGFLIKFSTANSQKFFYDDITINDLVLDTLPPLLDSIWANDSTECLLQFNEPIDSLTASNLLNYTLDGSTNPVSAKINTNSNSQVHLLFSSPFTPNKLNSILVKNIEDIDGNRMTNQSNTFKYHVARIGDLVINEIFADPLPQIGLPPFEFIELWNVSGSDINLQGFTLSDGTNTCIFPNTDLLKDSLIIVSSTASLNTYSSFGNSIVLPNFPSLNNDGDNITLANKQGQLIDEVNYDLTWYHNSTKSDGGWTLERINSKLGCKKIQNWSASTQTLWGGSPGKINSIHNLSSDTVAPALEKLEIINDSTAWVVFNTVMDSVSVSQIMITTSASVVISAKKVWNRNSDSLLLIFTPLQNKFDYTFTFSTAFSCNGVLMRPKAFSFTFDKPQMAQFSSIVISELLINPQTATSLPNSQYIELYNTGSYSINLKGMKISDGISTAILPDYKLKADSFIIVAPIQKYTEFSNYKIPALLVSSFPYLNIDNDNLFLTDSTNALINSMRYDTKALNNPLKSKGGWSLELIDANNACVMEGNWLYSINPNGGTPNQMNSMNGKVEDVLTLKFIRAYTIGLNEVVFIFNKFIDLKASNSPTLFEITPLINAGFNLSYHQNKANEISMKLAGGGLAKKTTYHATIKNIQDCGGKTMNTINVSFGYPTEPEYGDISINEILFDAKAYASEFIELYNTTDKIFDLNALGISTFDQDGIAHGTITASDVPLQLLPGKYLALCAERNGVISQYYSPSPENIFNTNDWLTLNDDSGLIVLSNLNTSNPIDSAYYSKNWHHPFITHVEGVSLERILFNRNGTLRLNWLSAASSVGYATPAYQNSKYSNSIAPEKFVFLSKNYFTPDNDGMDDELNFTIVLPSQNFAITITVYDINGNEIKKLAKNDVAAITNYYVWNGSTANGNLANTGHYLLLIQVVDENGNTKIAKDIIDLLKR